MAPNQLNAAAVGFETNCSGKSYINGVSYDILKKLQVVDTYQELLEARIGFREQSLRDCDRLLEKPASLTHA